MLKGEVIILRPVEESDLETYHRLQLDVEVRGEWFPREVSSFVSLKKEFEENGFWGEKFGRLLMIDNASSAIIGEILFFTTVEYMNEMEIGYIVYDTSARKKGATSEALNLLTEYLFDLKQINRIRLVIATDNAASRRVAEKCGYTHEGTMREPWFIRGRHIDGELYAITRSDLSAD